MNKKICTFLLITAISLTSIGKISMANTSSNKISITSENTFEEVTPNNYKAAFHKYLKENNIELTSENFAEVMQQFMEKHRLDYIDAD